MSRVITRFIGAALLAGLRGACEGSVNDDSNFFVLTSRTSTNAANVQSNGPSGRPVLTPDGRYLVFESQTSNIAPGETNKKQDIFRKDLQTGKVIIVSVDSTGTHANCA